MSVHRDLYAPRSRRADSPREIHEAERSGWMRGPRDQKSLKISNHFSLRLSARRLGGRCRPGAEIQNLSESVCQMRSYILTIQQASRAILHDTYSSDFPLWVFSNGSILNIQKCLNYQYRLTRDLKYANREEIKMAKFI